MDGFFRLVDDIIAYCFSPRGVDEELRGHPDRKEAFQLANSLFDRAESLHQALCVAAFAGGGAAYLKLFEILRQEADPWSPFVVAIGFFSMGLILYRGVRFLSEERIRVISRWK